MQIESAVLESAVSQVFVGGLLLWAAWRVNGSAACARLGVALLLAAAAIAALALAPPGTPTGGILVLATGGVVVSACALVLCAVCALLTRNPHGRRFLHPSGSLRVPLVVAVGASLPGLALAFLLAPATLACGWGSGVGALVAASGGALLCRLGRAGVEPLWVVDRGAAPLELLAVPLACCSGWFSCLSFIRGVDLVPPLCVGGVDLSLVLAGAWLLYRADLLARGTFTLPGAARP